MLRLSVLAMAGVAVRWTAATDVFAHVMMSNVAQYDANQWNIEVAKAKQMNLDGFALNWTPTRCQSQYTNQYVLDNMAWAFEAAEAAGNFKIYHSLDMSQTDCDGESFNNKYLYDIISKHSGSSAQYRVNSNVLVSTFNGNQEGTQYGSEWFSSLKQYMKDNNCAISLAPSFQNYDGQAKSDPEGAANALVSENGYIDGYKNWEGAWPSGGENITLASDEAFSAALKKAGKTGPYIMTVSPWWFRYGNAIGNQVKYGDNLLDSKLRQVFEGDFKPDVIEVLTWNDWAESHYLMDLPDFVGKADPAPEMVYDAEPQAVDYIERHNHSPWRIIARYWIAAIKSGSMPAATMDQAIVSYRRHPKSISCGEGQVSGSDKLDDAVFLWILVQEKSSIRVTIDKDHADIFDVEPNVPYTHKFQYPENLGSLSKDRRTPEVSISRNGEQLAYGVAERPIQGDCTTPDFNPISMLVGQGENKGSAY